MSRAFRAIAGTPPVFYQAMIEVDADSAAERLLIFNRITGNCYHNVAVSVTGITQLRVPLSHTDNNTLLVGIVDDDGTYNCKFVDGVKAQLVDGNVLSMKR
ncbi:hypothetical protein PY479_05175 [Shewanella sp. A32]|uniref:hypothetical protein n=1 Tax=Shewanella sp. A32 TaxID=3031327 RepID=UPI0023B91B9F|nr:hypothetical protein [Shewanella sp. A32]MDF0533671.1 hypothetical protein [Shewanella sp. A32]